jgi:membrane associated rhomboid family serine protease
LQTTILRVDGKRKASVHDPRRVLAGTLTAALTWGLFGLVAGTNRVESTVIWAVLGALCGGAYAYLAEHLLTKSELERIGRSLGPDSSALAIFVETHDPEKLLEATAASSPVTASAALIDSDLSARVFAGSTSPMEVPHGGMTPEETSVLSMLVFRYPDPKTAARVVSELPKAKPHPNGAPQIELVIETEPNGRRRVTDPTRGTAAWARSDIVSWGLFGLVFGALAGWIGGGGLHGAVKAGVDTGIGWAVFGLFAGALYGLWAGRSTSARRLKGIGPVLAPGTSAVLAWSEGPVRGDALDALTRQGSQQLVLRFNPVDGGAVLEAA